MTNEKLNPLIPMFISNTKLVLKEMANIHVSSGSLEKVYAPIVLSGVASLLSVFGYVNFRVIFDMKSDTSVIISNNVLSGDFAEIDENVFHTLMELNNIISGRVVTECNNKRTENPELRLSSPGVYYGEDLEIGGSTNEVLKIILETDAGFINIYLNSE